MGAINPLRYRGYVYDAETGLYYLQSRYYNPETGRFINADGYATTGQGFLGNNMFAYCGNNPVCRVDIAGNFWDTVFDIASLCYGIYDVWQNPDDPMAWVGLVGDVIDIAVPFVSGVGETARLAKCGDKIIDTAGVVHDISRTVDPAIAAREATKHTLSEIYQRADGTLGIGDNFVYVAYHSDGSLEYVGITNDFGRREREWEKVREIDMIRDGLDRPSARILEQAAIDAFGMSKIGGTLSNKINSIGKNTDLYAKYTSVFYMLK